MTHIELGYLPGGGRLLNLILIQQIYVQTAGVHIESNYLALNYSIMQFSL